MSKSDKEKVQDGHKRVGQTAKVRRKNAKNPAGMPVKAIKEMKYKLKAQMIIISDMKAKFDIETDDPVTNDAGNSFGGRK